MTSSIPTSVLAPSPSAPVDAAADSFGEQSGLLFGLLLGGLIAPAPVVQGPGVVTQGYPGASGGATASAHVLMGKAGLETGASLLGTEALAGDPEMADHPDTALSRMFDKTAQEGTTADNAEPSSADADPKTIESNIKNAEVTQSAQRAQQTLDSGELSADGEGAPVQFEPQGAMPATTGAQHAGNSAHHAAGQQAVVPSAPVSGPAVAPGSSQPVHAAESIDGMVSITSDGNRLAVTLEPDGLGRLHINLSMQKGLVIGQIQVNDDSTKQLIEQRMHEVVSALLREGISVGGFSVSLRGGGTDGGHDAGGQESMEHAETSPARDGAEGSSAAPASGLVNLFV